MTAYTTPKSSRLWAVTIAALALSYGIAFDSPDAVQEYDNGRATFIEKGCARCHAIYGYGPGGTKPSGGPDLGQRQVYGTRLQIAAELWNHLPDMLKRMDRDGITPPIFTGRDVDAIIEYLSFLRYMDAPGNERTGRRLLRNKKCTTCHRIGEDGGDMGPELTPTESYVAPLDLATALWNHGPAMNDDFEAMNVERPSFGRRDIKDMAAGIRSFIATSTVPVGAFQPGDPSVGEELVGVKQCTGCHAVRGQGGSLAPDFADMDFGRTVTEIAGSMWNHGPAMWEVMQEEQIPFPVLERREMADIIAFLYSLGLEDPPGHADRGAQLVDSKRCTACHSLRGSGGSLAADLSELGSLESPTEMVAGMWSHAADMVEYSKEERVKWPSLSGEELADIISFLRGLSAGAH